MRQNSHPHPPGGFPRLPATPKQVSGQPASRKAGLNWSLKEAGAQGPFAPTKAEEFQGFGTDHPPTPSLPPRLPCSVSKATQGGDGCHPAPAVGGLQMLLLLGCLIAGHRGGAAQKGSRLCPCTSLSLQTEALGGSPDSAKAVSSLLPRSLLIFDPVGCITGSQGFTCFWRNSPGTFQPALFLCFLLAT